MRVARGLELREPFLRDALDIAHCEEAAQMILVVHDDQFVDAEMLGEKFVGARDGILAEFFLVDGMNLPARRERLGNFLFRVARFHDVAGQQADQFSFFVNDGKSSERKFPFLDDFQNVADELFR